MERIEKVIALYNNCSRQDAKKLIREGHVLLNGQLLEKAGILIDPQADIVQVDGTTLDIKPKELFLVLNKPCGHITSRADPSGHPSVFDLLPADTRSKLHAVGRLDLDSTGLLLFTSNGSLTHLLTHPKHHVEKEYIVILDGILDEHVRSSVEKGITLDGELTKPCTITKVIPAGAGTELHIILKEGKHRQIRRMFAKFGLSVTGLHRIRLGRIELGDLPKGSTRPLSAPETEWLNNALL
jgi:23S rRNA pseudouridine2605 synthase